VIVQRAPWASGKTQPAPTAATPKPKPRRRRRKMSTRGKALVTFLEGGGLIMLGCAQIFQMSALVFAGATTMALGVLQVWFEKHQTAGVPTPTAARPKPAKPAKTAGSGGRRKPGTSAVKCTRTGQPIDQCGCAKRHVATADGARRYRRQVGDPIGGGGKVSTAKPAAPSRVPATNNAKPHRMPVGEVMRRDY